MNRHRIFIAINLPENVKKHLIHFQKKWWRSDVPCSWTKSENLHITLVFLGYLTDTELIEVCKITKQVASKHNSFSIELNKILYAPPQKPIKMIWAEGKENKELTELQNDFKTYFNELKSDKIYIPHITLGRLKQWEFKKINPEERPQINEEIFLKFRVNSIEVMESELKRGGSKYTILKSFSLLDKNL